MKKLMIISLAMFLFVATSCTEKQRAKNFGGQFTVELPKNKKLVVVTWKNDNMWYLTRTRRANEKVESYVFEEDASFGIMEGKVLFNEN